MNYTEFLETKRYNSQSGGIKSNGLNPMLYDFQKMLTKWALDKGKAAICADCGLGKTPIQLVWADEIFRYTNKPVLILTPLAVSAQTVHEGNKFGIEVSRSKDGLKLSKITVTNYESLHNFNSVDFAGVVCDESSILKSFDGIRRSEITDFMRQVPYALLCTATAAPNDYIELGTSSEALGELGYTDMLTRFFVNDQNVIKPMVYRHRGSNFQMVTERNKWRFKGHAMEAFWKWVSSWARAMRKPSDFGFNDGDFILQPFEERHTIIKSRIPRPGMLFDIPAVGLSEEREVRRRTLTERCEAAADKVADGKTAVIWCHLNDEGDMLKDMVPDSVQVSGADSDDSKEAKFEAFQSGKVRVLVIKPKIGAFGLNWQHCSHVVYFPSDSYEQYYQAVRRCWRFGQKNPVTVDLIYTDSQERMLNNLLRKSKAADEMFTALNYYMNESLSIGRSNYDKKIVEVPAWMK
ncbi:MAG: helicase-related protein [Dehalococcoidales bacterium]|jgi:hypothetical protein